MKNNKKVISTIVILIISVICIICIYSGILDFLQNTLNASYFFAKTLSYLFIIILFAVIYICFEKLEKDYKNEIKHIVSLTNIISQFNYNNLNNIKKIIISDNSNYQIILKTEPESTITFNMSSIPQNQNELEILDQEIILKRK